MKRARSGYFAPLRPNIKKDAAGGYSEGRFAQGDKPDPDRQ
jgi:hypothetical protein